MTPLEKITEWVGRLPGGSIVCAQPETAGVVQSAVDAAACDVEVRAHPWAPAGAVLALTSFDSLQVAARGQESDADDIWNAADWNAR